MKIKSKEYAKALVAVMDSKNDKKVIDNFLALLQKKGDVRRLKEIIQLAETLYLKKLGHRKLAIYTARARNNNLLKSIAKKGDIVEEFIDESLIAGAKIVVNNERQLDVSLKSKLDEL